MTNEQRQFTAQDQTFPVILVRKKVKNINLHVRSDGTLYISAPARVPWEYIEDFLQKKTDFIVRAMDEMAERKRKFPMLTLSDGDTLYLAGQPYKLDVRLGLQNSIRRSGQTVFMELADDTPVMKQKLYHKLLQSLGKKLFPASLSRMQPLFDGLALPDPVLKQRVMRSRWGSCMPLKGIVTMNTYLAIMPEEIIDHVMLHELCHFLQPNHSRHFYDAMTIRMPDWKARRQAMTKYLPYCV
ncbi:M48 family metallopeptidase [Megasphaera elsdenii]|uniref:M48 family metallopeptidase n=1 Tax=Megasphaera elsdenii TaxID=907 RepID=UPI003399BEFB